MNTIWQWFWEAVIVGCLLWYTIATVYIAIRGVSDLTGLLARLKDDHESTHADMP